jgi:hypothetical protein
MPLNCLLLIASLLLAPFLPARPSVSLYDFGIYYAKVAVKGDWKKGVPVTIESIRKEYHEEPTTRIPCQPGTVWGMRLTYKNPTARSLICKSVFEHPEFTLPDGTKSSRDFRSFEIPAWETRFQGSYWVFLEGCKHEFVPGIWTQRIFVDGQEVARKDFEVVKPGPRAPPTPTDRVSFGKDTTRITGPIRSDGFPGYAAALNERLSRGVTVDNNAAVPLIRAFGTKYLWHPEPLCRALGVEMPSEHGKYFVDEVHILTSFYRDRFGEGTGSEELDKIYDRFEESRQRPWSRREFPLVARWLDQNEEPLKLIEEAARRPRLYEPCVGASRSASLVEISLHCGYRARESAELLTTRAMFRLKCGNAVGAWRDLLESHRLARLTSTGPEMMDSVVAHLIEHMTYQADLALFHHLHLSRAEIERRVADIKKLPALEPDTDKIDLYQRYLFLDNVCDCVNGWLPFRVYPHIERNPLRDTPIQAIADALVDWDETLRVGNRWYDELVANSRLSGRDRYAANRRSLAEIERHAIEARSPHIFLLNLFSSHRRQRFGQQAAGYLADWLKGVAMLMDYQQLRDMNQTMFQTGIALALYRADHGQYPESLDSLAPKYLAALPIDSFSPSGDPIRYRREREAYALWTVYLNGIDDGGPPADWVKGDKRDDQGFHLVPIERKARSSTVAGHETPAISSGGRRPRQPSGLFRGHRLR